MRKSAAKANKVSLPATEAEVAVPVQVTTPGHEPEPSAKETVAAPVVSEQVSTDESAPAQTIDVAVAAETFAPQEEQADSPKSAKQGKARKIELKKPKLIRDSFTFPEFDYALLAVLKKRALNSGCEIKKSELLRAGLNALNAMSEEELLKVLGSVERIKTGRPSK